MRAAYWSAVQPELLWRREPKEGGRSKSHLTWRLCCTAALAQARLSESFGTMASDMCGACGAVRCTVERSREPAGPVRGAGDRRPGATRKMLTPIVIWLYTVQRCLHDVGPCPLYIAGKTSARTSNGLQLCRVGIRLKRELVAHPPWVWFCNPVVDPRRAGWQPHIVQHLCESHCDPDGLCSKV